MQESSSLFCFVSLAFLLCFSVPLANANEARSQLNPIGTNRLVLVCLTDTSIKAVERASSIYNALDWDGFAQRHLEVFEVQNNSVQLINPTQQTWQRVEQTQYAKALRRRANCKGDLDFVLIGKDTGEKRRWRNDLPRRELFDTIDAMPMRQYEMRYQGELR